MTIPDACTPRMDMHMCSASMTTADSLWFKMELGASRPLGSTTRPDRNRPCILVACLVDLTAHSVSATSLVECLNRGLLTLNGASPIRVVVVDDSEDLRLVVRLALEGSRISRLWQRLRTGPLA